MLSAEASGVLGAVVRLSDGLGSRTRSVLMLNGPVNAAAIITDACSTQVNMID